MLLVISTAGVTIAPIDLGVRLSNINGWIVNFCQGTSQNQANRRAILKISCHNLDTSDNLRIGNDFNRSRSLYSLESVIEDGSDVVVRHE